MNGQVNLALEKLFKRRLFVVTPWNGIGEIVEMVQQVKNVVM